MSTPVDWRKSFRQVSELDDGPVKMLIENILPTEGVTFIGSLSGVGKTWVALSMAKALRTGEPLFGRFPVPEIVPVAYLVPEMGSRAVRKRIETLQIPDHPEFLLRTMKEGRMQLTAPELKAMVQELKPVIFLDTAIRFTNGVEENSSGQNAAGLAEAIFTLLRAGARAVVCLHHSPKASGHAPFMTLENVLRGTGDFGAICEVVWGIERARRKKGKGWDHEYAKESDSLTRLHVENVKGRDADVADPFMIQGRPYLAERGDFVVIRSGDTNIEPDARNDEEKLKTLLGMIATTPTVSKRSLTKATGWNNEKVTEQASSQGYRQVQGVWVNSAALPTATEKVTSHPR